MLLFPLLEPVVTESSVSTGTSIGETDGDKTGAVVIGAPVIGAPVILKTGARVLGLVVGDRVVCVGPVVGDGVDSSKSTLSVFDSDVSESPVVSESSTIWVALQFPQ